jgi:hypothetical protein
MPRPQVSVVKRQREQAKRERQQKKAERRAERKTTTTKGEGGPPIEAQEDFFAQEPADPEV